MKTDTVGSGAAKGNGPLQTDLLLEAIDLGRQSQRRPGGGPFGAVIGKGSECVARGANQVVSASDPTAHAEVVAIRAACAQLGTHRLIGHQLYTSCEPCPMCLGAAHWARVDHIYFAASRADAAALGFDDAVLYREVSLPLAERQIPTIQAFARQAQEMMKAWSRVPAERHY